MSAFSGAESVEVLTKGAKFEAKEYLPTRSVAFDWSALSAMLKAALCASGYSAGANVKSSERADTPPF